MCITFYHEAPVTADSGSYTRGLVTADLNADHVVDVIQVGQYGLRLLQGNGSGGFVQTGTVAMPYFVGGVAAGDVTGNGLQDIVVGQSGAYDYNVGTSANQVAVLGNTGTGFAAPVAHALGSGGYYVTVAVGDLNGDGVGDVVATQATYQYDATLGYNHYVDRATVLLGDGSGGVVGPFSFALNGSYYAPQVAAGDLRGIGRSDVVVLVGGVVQVLLSATPGGAPDAVLGAASTVTSVGTFWTQLAVADLNHDGRADIVMAGIDYASGGALKLEVLLSNGDGSFAAPNVLTVSSAANLGSVVGLAVADFNLDGQADVAITDNKYYATPGSVSPSMFVLRGDGAGGFGTADIASYDFNIQASSVADINGDGWADLLVTGSDGSMSAWLNTTTPELSIARADAFKAEGNSGSTPFTFTVSRVDGLNVAGSVVWSVAGSSAAAADAADFVGGVLPTGTLSFAVGQARATVTVNVAGDTAVETTEGFTVSLGATTGGLTVGALGSATGAIVDDDRAVPAISRAFFSAATPESGYEIWMTDGTAGGTSMVTDLRPGPRGSYPGGLTAFGDGVLFNADDGSYGRGLWYSDGSAGGTRLVIDANVVPFVAGTPRDIVVAGDRAFLTLFDQVSNRELWVTDGTAAGTSLVADINPGYGRGRPLHLTAFNNDVLFSAYDSSHGRELWISDGTAGGTSMLADIAGGAISSSPYEFAVLGNQALFSAFDTTHGRELWVTDGTSGGTSLLVDINPGGNSSSVGPMLRFGDRVVFTAYQAGTGRELWVSDGTAAGTSMVADLSPGAGSGMSNTAALASMAVLGDKVVFEAAGTGMGEPGLWVTDGTAAGTQQIAANAIFNELTTIGNHVVMTGYDAAHGFELWVTDGTAAGTSILSDINPGTADSAPADLTVVGDQVMFSVSDPVNGSALWVTDGTAAGTSALATPYPTNDPGSQPLRRGLGHAAPRIRSVNGKTMFAAGSAGQNGNAGDRLLWVTDGTAAGTSVLTTLSGVAPVLSRAGEQAAGLNTYPQFVLGSQMLFTAWTASQGYELWTTDGTSSGTRVVRDINAGAGSSYATPLGLLDSTHALLSASDGINGAELWVTDGSFAGTSLLKNINPGGDSYPNWVTRLGSQDLFTANNGSDGIELWITDGSSAGTSLVKDINTAAGQGSDPRALTTIGDKVVFFAQPVTGAGFHLWASDGTAGGTAQISSVGYVVEAQSPPFGLRVMGGHGFFAGDDGTHGSALWVTDGTAAGTSLLADINPTGDAAPGDLVVLGGQLLFAADDGVHGRELWTSDGTAGGTSLLADLVAGAASGNPYDLVVFGSKVLFQATDAAHGSELWISDGTASGTSLLKDINPGAHGSAPMALAVSNGRVFFQANDGSHGYELWSSDGTAAGTTMVADLISGEQGPRPNDITPASGVVTPGASSFAISTTDTAKAEGNSGSTGFVFTVRRSGDTSLAQTVDYGVTGSGGAPADAADFVGGFAGGTLSFAAGQTTQAVTVLVAGDTAIEADEGFSVSLANPTSGAALGTASAAATILNDDFPAASFAIAASDAVKAEGNAGATPFLFTVTRSGSLVGAGSVAWSVTGGVTAPSANAADFVGGIVPQGTLSFADGQASQTITVEVQGDTLPEGDESFRVVLSGAGNGATISTAIADASILNDDTTLAIAASSANKAEGNAGTTPFSFTVTRAGAVGGVTTVRWAATGLAPNSANPADFAGGVVPTGTLTFAAGQTSQTITVNIQGDTLAEADEHFRMVLSAPSGGAAITTASADATIINDDTNFAIASTTGSRPEGDSGSTPFLFTVTRSGSLAGSNTVAWYTVGAAPNSVGPLDFAGGVVPTGTLSFAAGQASQTITVNVAGDTYLEPDEFFSVGLRQASGGAAITQATALAKIVNDDTSFSIAATSAVKAEGNAGSTPVTFTVTRTGNIAGTHSIGWLVSGQQPNSVGLLDFVSGSPLSGGLLFLPGETSKTITVQVQGDPYVEPDEHFVVLLRNASAGAAISVNNASGTILNDDGAPADIGSALTARASADFNGDGVADTLRAAADGGLFVLDGASGVQHAVSLPTAGLGFLAALDLNGDGRADLLLQDGSGGIFDWTMQGAQVQHSDLLAQAGAGAQMVQASAAAGVVHVLLHDQAAAAPWMVLDVAQGGLVGSQAYLDRPLL